MRAGQWNRDAEHDAYMDYMDAAYEKWAAEHADQIVEDEYQRWAEVRREDGEDYSREAWDDYCQSIG